MIKKTKTITKKKVYNDRTNFGKVMKEWWADPRNEKKILAMKRKMASSHFNLKASDKTKKKMSLKSKGKNNGFYGKHHTKKTKLKISNNKDRSKKISKSLTGRTFSEEHIKNLVKSHKGKMPANLEQLKSFGIAMKGKKRPKEIGRKITESLKKHWKSLPEKVKQEKIKTLILAGQNNAPGTKDTSIELIIQDFLKQLKIPFEKHKFMPIKHRYLCDIFVPSLNLVIECDGDYWHNYPKGTKNDLYRNDELSLLGYGILRLWERDIRLMDLKSFKEILNSLIKNGK